MAGSRKGLHDIAPKIRAGFVRAAARKGNGNAEEAIATQIEKLWEKDFLAILQAIGKFTVRENKVSGKIEHEHDHKHRSLSETDAWIAEVTGRRPDSTSEKSLPH